VARPVRGGASDIVAGLPGLARLLETMRPPAEGNGGSVAAAPPAEAAPAPTEAPDELLLGGVAAAMALVKAHRMHGHLAEHLDPLGSEPVGARRSSPSV